MSLAMDYTPQTWHSVLFYVVRPSFPLHLRLYLIFQAILLLLGCVGMTATGRSHKFWICGGEFLHRIAGDCHADAWF
jgi:hypothetical protein